MITKISRSRKRIFFFQSGIIENIEWIQIFMKIQLSVPEVLLMGGGSVV